MEDNSSSSRHQPPAPAPSSRLGMRGGGSAAGGEIVEVQGGHIVRSTGRKDRHSKVCTAKGPRDRRVRLSAHTAIQFYDVQDRLGYDRPSKAVDWLIKKAKSAIDELAELPPWHPNTSASTATVQPEQQNEETEIHHHQVHHSSMVDPMAGSGSRAAMVGEDGRVVGGECSVHSLQQQMNENNQNSNNSSSFLPPSLDSDAIADTIKSFFPMGAAAHPHQPPQSQFQNYPPDLLSRTSSQSQDLRLSLQSFQDPNFLHHNHHQSPQNHHHQSHHEPVIFSGTAHMGFDASSAGWSEHHHHPAAEMGRLQRMVSWNAASGGADNTGSSGGGGGSGGGGAFMFASPPTPSPLLQPLFGGQNQFFSQRGPLQSSNSPSIRAWMDPPPQPIATTTTSPDHHHHHHQFPFQHSISGIGFASGGFSGFHIPARIHGEEEHDGISNKPSSASSDSRH